MCSSGTALTQFMCSVCVFISASGYPTIQDFARKMVGSDTISPEQMKQIREQKEVSWSGFPGVGRVKSETLETKGHESTSACSPKTAGDHVYFQLSRPPQQVLYHH